MTIADDYEELPKRIKMQILGLINKGKLNVPARDIDRFLRLLTWKDALKILGDNGMTPAVQPPSEIRQQEKKQLEVKSDNDGPVTKDVVKQPEQDDASSSLTESSEAVVQSIALINMGIGGVKVGVHFKMLSSTEHIYIKYVFEDVTKIRFKVGDRVRLNLTVDVVQ